MQGSAKTTAVRRQWCERITASHLLVSLVEPIAILGARSRAIGVLVESNDARVCGPSEPGFTANTTMAGSHEAAEFFGRVGRRSRGIGTVLEERMRAIYVPHANLHNLDTRPGFGDVVAFSWPRAWPRNVEVESKQIGF